MTTITNAIKPTMLISSPIPTPSIQFAARLPTTFLPIRTKLLSSSSKPLSVTVKCSNNLNLTKKISDLEDSEYEIFVERMAAAVEQVYSNEIEEARELVSLGKPKFIKDMLQGIWRRFPVTEEVLEFMIVEQAKQSQPLILKTVGGYFEEGDPYEADMSPEDAQRLRERLKWLALNGVWFGCFFD